jgi:hypothetical protein
MRPRYRLFSFAVLVLIFLHLCGATGQVTSSGLVTWPVGPCALERHRGKAEMIIGCGDHDLVRLWPLPFVPSGDSLAGGGWTRKSPN